MQNARALQKNLGRAVCILRLRRGSGARFFHARGGEQRQKRQQRHQPRNQKQTVAGHHARHAVDNFFNAESIDNRCCFSKRMRKVFRKNEKSMLQNCNKKAKRKGRLQRVKKPM